MKARSLAAIAFAVALIVAACGQPGAASEAGIKGLVTVGPTCPVEQAGQSPCVAPYVATLVIANGKDGKLVARVTSGPDGRFQVTVPPGDYVIAPQPGGQPYPVAPAVAVNVKAGAFTEVTVTYDTGVR